MPLSGKAAKKQLRAVVLAMVTVLVLVTTGAKPRDALGHEIAHRRNERWKIGGYFAERPTIISAR